MPRIAPAYPIRILAYGGQQDLEQLKWAQSAMFLSQLKSANVSLEQPATNRDALCAPIKQGHDIEKGVEQGHS